MKRLLLAAMISAGLAGSVHAGGLESFVGKKPAALLKQEKPFAKAYRIATRDADLPRWTEKPTGGFPTEALELEGKTLLLVSACSPNGCADERLYALYAPADQSITGLLFLPDADGESRIVFSRWFGKTPTPVQSQYLLERASNDAEPARPLPNQ